MANTLRTYIRWTLSGGQILDSVSESVSSTITTPTKFAKVVDASLAGANITADLTAYTGIIFIKHIGSEGSVALEFDDSVISSLGVGEFILLNRTSSFTVVTATATVASIPLLIQGVSLDSLA